MAALYKPAFVSCQPKSEPFMTLTVCPIHMFACGLGYTGTGGPDPGSVNLYGLGGDTECETICQK